MEINKVVMNIDDRDYLLDRLDAILHDTHCQQYKDEVCEALSKYIVTVTRNTSDLKPFDLNSAKAGKPVCTRDGRKARILCFDRFCCDEISTIVACVLSKDGKDENVIIYSSDGFMVDKQHPCADDLMILPEKKEKWINIYKKWLYDFKEDAIEGITDTSDYICTVKVELEE